MVDYIDREKLIRDLIDKGFYPALVKRTIENEPTEAVIEISAVVKIIKEITETIKSRTSCPSWIDEVVERILRRYGVKYYGRI